MSIPSTSLLLTVTTLFCPFLSFTLSAQLSLAALELDYGNYAVGYHHDTIYDATRAYQVEGDWDMAANARPLPLSIWYPAIPDQPDTQYSSVMDYLRIMRDEGEWSTLPDSLILGWFAYADTPVNRARSREVTRAIVEGARAAGRFPVVIYAPGFMGSSTENFALCELLASRGYVVLAAPGRGASSISMRGTAGRNAEGQAQDLAFLKAYARTLPYVQPDNIALMDYSFGGLATALLAMRDPSIKAVVSLDGRSRYDLKTLLASPFTNLNAFRAPFFHAAQKAIPEKVLLADGIDPALNTEFKLFDTLANSSVYALRFHNLSHRHFCSFGLLLGSADARQDKSDTEVVPAYRALTRYVTEFLDAELRRDAQARSFLSTNPAKQGYADSLLSQGVSSMESSLSFQEFHVKARSEEYRGLNTLYENARQAYPNFVIPEWKLNDLGLRLGFGADSYANGLKIYHFALSLYPESANLWDSLGLIQQVNGDDAEAIKSYRKSLALNPGNEHAKMRLGQLE